MPTIFNNIFSINGVVDTSKTVLDNLEILTGSSGCWLSYDISQGKWSVVINKDGASVASFGDSNIIGGITLNSTGITELYNSVEVSFPHKDIKDRRDFITLSIAAGDRYPNELDNVLKIELDTVNDPLQAEYIAARELKQSRIDKVIEFRTDYSYMGLKAGELISVTNSALGFTSKLFRIVKLTEEDGDDGVFNIAITALEYDASIYSTTGLTKTTRTVDNGIVPEEQNEAIQTSQDVSTGTQLLRLLGTTFATGLLNSFFTKNPLTGKVTQTIGPTNAARDQLLTAMRSPKVTITGPSVVCEGQTITLTIALDCAISCFVDTTQLEWDYAITGVQASDINYPLTGKVKAGTVNIPTIVEGGIENETLVYTLTYGSNTVSHSVQIKDPLNYTYVTTAASGSITEGGSTSVLLTTTGLVNGTLIPYTITGSAVSRVSTPLVGNVTINSGTATLNITTINDGIYQGNGSITVTFDTFAVDSCGQLDNTAAITILDNESPPAVCEYVSVPLVWCGSYNGNDNQLESITVKKTALMPKALAGEATIAVPTAVSVTKGNPSTITVTATENIATSLDLGGIDLKIITSFNSVQPKGLITGTTTTIRGYL